MKFLGTLLTAAALFSSCAFSAPLDESNLLAVRVDRRAGAAQNTGGTQASGSGSSNLPDYDIETVLKSWVQKTHVQERLAAVCTTDGGWESWAQYEVEQEFRKAFSIKKKDQIREVHVYENAKEAADFVLPATDKLKGMIIELKCENKNTNKGKAMKNKVQGDIDKEKNLKADYKGYTFRVLAMAYSADAGTVIEGLGLTAIPGVEVDQVSSSDESDSGKSSDGEGDTLKVYQKTVSTGSATAAPGTGDDDGVDDITKGVDNLTTDDKTKDKSKDKSKDTKDKSKDTKDKTKDTKSKTKDKGGK